MVTQREFEFLSANCSLGPTRTVDEVCKIVFKQLLRHIPDKNLFEKTREVFDRYIIRHYRRNMGQPMPRGGNLCREFLHSATGGRDA